MPYLTAPQPINPYIPVFWNLDAPVGEDCPNLAADVLLVQFLLHIIAAAPRQDGFDASAGLATLPPVAVTGRMDAATARALRALQAGGVTSEMGIVSPARGYWHNGALWLIIFLNSAAARRHPDVYPRLDLLADCPPALAQIFRAGLIGTE